MFLISRIRALLQQLELKETHKGFRETLATFRQLNVGDNRLSVADKDFFPRLNDATAETEFDGHYIYHPAWAARVVKKINPVKHIDISSTLHFCSILSTFIPTDFYDYRPARLNLSNLSSGAADLTQLFFETDSIDSLSCMHTIEHIGLGRYGDPIDPAGDLKAIGELKRVVKKGGHLLFVTPVGAPRVQFNAHRIYSYEMIASYFAGFDLMEFSLVTDGNDFIENASPELVARQRYGCGCFWFKKA